MSVALLVLPDFLLIALGALLKRSGGFGTALWPGVERLVYFVLFPALLFRSLATAPLQALAAAPMVAVAVAFTLAGMLLALLGRPLLRLAPDTFAACFQCAFRFNTYVAIAIATRLDGPRGLALISLAIGVLVPLVNVAAVGMLASGRLRDVPREILRNPLVLACAAGLGANALALPIPGIAARVLELLASAALPLGLLAVGAALVFRGDALSLRAIAFFGAIKLVALPAIAVTLAALLALDAAEARAVLIMAAVPPATSAYVLAVQMRAPGAPVALLITSGTLASIVTMTLWLSAIGAG